MSTEEPFTTQLLQLYADHVYQDLVKPKIPTADRALKSEAPVRSGHTRKHTYVFLDKRSNDEQVLIRMRSAPPAPLPKYPGHSRASRKRPPGDGALGALSNAHRRHPQEGKPRILQRSTGWWNRAIDKASAVFLR